MDLEGLSGVCSGLGIADEDEAGVIVGYTKGPYCLDNLKDLQRFLRRDDPQTREVFKQVCKWNVASLHLVPIIDYWQTDHKLVVNAVKVLVFLTMPVDPSSDNVAQQIEHLWSLKAAITRNETIAVIMSILEDPLEHLESGAFTEDDWKLVQLVLTLFRNVLAIHEITLEQKASGSSSQLICLRDKFLEVLFLENVSDVILILAQHITDSCGYLHQDIFLILEVFYYILMGHDPKRIVLSAQKNSEGDGVSKTPSKSLESIMEEEEERRLNRLRNLDFCSRFSGTFTRLAMDGSKLLLNGNPAAAFSNALLKTHKTPKGPIKRTAWNHENRYLPNERILKLIYDFVSQFLSGGYNVLMQSIQDEIEREHQAIETGDIIIFFQVAHFVTAFQHHKFSVLKYTMNISESQNSYVDGSDNTLFHGDICGPLAATMNEAMFLLVISQWRDAFEGLKQTNDYKFISAAGSVMKEMIRMLALVLELSPEDSTEPQIVRILLYKLFYDQTDQGFTYFLVNLVRSFDPHKQPKSDLADLVEIFYTVVLLMERLQARGTLRVSKISRRGRIKKHLDNVNVEAEKSKEAHPNTQNTDNQDQKDCLLNSIEVINEPIDDSLVNSSADGRKGILQQTEDTGLQNDAEDDNLGQQNNYSTGFNHLVYEQGNSSGDEQQTEKNEVDFNISKLVVNFANNTCVQNLCWLLKFYKSNSQFTNDHIVYMLQKICDDLELSPMLYQLSLLTIFYNIIDEQKSANHKEYASIISFLTKLVRKLLKKLKNQPLLFVEILFWKTQRECRLMNADTLTYEIKKLKRQARNLGSTSDDGEDVGLLKKKEFVGRRSIADALGEDEADLPFSQDLDNQMDKQSWEGAHQGAYNKNSSFEFSPEQEALIRELHEKYKSHRNCSRLIAEALNPNGNVSAVQISAKLKKLGLKVEWRSKRHLVEEPISGDKAQTALMDVGSKDLEYGSVETSSVSRKRVCVFSKEQEVMIRQLFEQYKNHRRCSHMISKALDADNVYSAAQISRKLRQLGLQAPHQKRKAGFDKDSKQNDVKSVSGSEVEISERESRRRKNTSKSKKVSPMPEISLTPEEYSDEDVLSTILRKYKKSTSSSVKEAIKTDIRESENQLRLPRDEKSDDEMLSSILQKSGKVLAKPENKNDETFSSQDIELESSSFCAPKNTIEGLSPQHHEQEPSEAYGSMEVQLNESGEKLGEDDDGLYDHLMDDELADELADSGDDVEHAMPKGMEGRRRAKMIFDSDDE